MTDNRDSDNLSYSAEEENKISARALKIEPVSSNQGKIPYRNICRNCNSRILVVARKEVNYTLDLDGKRHFCLDVDRILHEEKCIIEIKRILDKYNRTEFSSFQVEWIIP